MSYSKLDLTDRRVKALQEALWKARDIQSEPGAKEAEDALQGAVKALENGRLKPSAMDLFDFQQSLGGGTYGMGFLDSPYGSQSRDGRTRTSALDFLLGIPVGRGVP